MKMTDIGFVRQGCLLLASRPLLVVKGGVVVSPFELHILLLVCS